MATNKKTAIITGASSGIGKAVAIDLAQQNYYVILISRSQQKLENTKQQIESMGQSASVYALDVANSDAVKKCVAKIVSQQGRIDVLFNNAGLFHKGTSDITIEQMDEVIKINLLGAMYMAKFVAMQMQKQHSGYIFNLSSMSGKRAVPNYGVYAASKFGLNGYNEALLKKMLPYGVKVTTICPSFVATDMTKGFGFPVEKMMQVTDVVKIIRCLLELGENASIPEVQMQCIPYEIMMLEAISAKSK
jgi:short-subunit dehydrogenase